MAMKQAIHPDEEKPVSRITRVGVDIAKSVFHVHAVDRDGRCVWQANVRREAWIEAVCKRVPTSCEIAMEACGAAHRLRGVSSLGPCSSKARVCREIDRCPVCQTIREEPQERSRRRRAITEAMARPTMRFVAVKSGEQLDLQAVHRIRAALIKLRTAKTNQIRGLVGEYGIVAPIGIAQLRRAIPIWLDNLENGLIETVRVLLRELGSDLMTLDERVDAQDQRIATKTRQSDSAQRLMKLRGVGPLGATALVVALGSGSSYARGRDFAAALGLVPHQHSTEGREWLLGITKRGDPYLPSCWYTGREL